MRKKSGLAAAALVLFLGVLLLAGLERGNHLFDFRFVKFESPLYFVVVVFLAVGAFCMFLLVSLYPPEEKRNRLPAPSTAQLVPPTARQAEISMQLGELERAEEILDSIPDDPTETWYVRKLQGDLAAAAGNEAEADELYQESLKLCTRENQPYVLFILADAYERTDQAEKALDLYEEILKRTPMAAEPALRLRRYAVRQQNWGDALHWQETIEERMPEVLSSEEELFQKVGIRCEFARFELDHGSPKNAMALIKSAMRMTDNFVPAYLLLGDIQQRQENPSAALKTWERGFRATRNPALLQRMAEAYLIDNHPEKALEVFQDATREFPDDDVLEFCLGDLYSKLEMLQEARRIFEGLEARSPGWSLNQKTLADLYRRTGDNEKAARIYASLLNSESGNPAQAWVCYSCNTTFPSYRTYCTECLEWSGVQFNQNKAESIGLKNAKVSALQR